MGFILLSSCAELSLEECQYENWRAKGVMDGLEGEPASRIVDYQRDCARHGISINATDYETGRVEGVKQFCTRDKGYQVGISGRAYKNSCTAANQNQFLSGYNPARKMYTSHSAFRQAQSQANSNRNRVDRLERDIDKLQKESRDASTEEERSEITQRIRAHEREIDDLTEQARDARYRLPYLRTQCHTALAALIAAGFVSPYTCF